MWPQWSPDGQWVTFRSGSFGDGSLWSTRADGTEEPELLFDEFDAAKGV
jgi:Tol biopolymer transport system component